MTKRIRNPTPCRIFLVSAAFALVSVIATPSFSGSAALTDEEIQQALLAQFGKTPSRAAVIKGTRLYLYKPYQSKLYNINSLGFRGPELKAKSKNDFVIAIAGGSAVFGTYLSDFHTLPACLEVSLRKRFPGKNIIVHNLGIEGYVLQREVELVKRLRAQLDPDLMVFFDGANNILNAYYYGYEDFRPFDGNDETFFVKKNAIRKNFFLLMRERFIADMEKVRMRLANDPQKNKEAFLKGYASDAADISQYFGDGQNGKKVPVFFVLQPTLLTKKYLAPQEGKAMEAYLGYAEYYKEWADSFEKTMAASGLRFYSLAGIFNEVTSPVFLDMVHLGSTGNRIVAERLADILEPEISKF